MQAVETTLQIGGCAGCAPCGKNQSERYRINVDSRTFRVLYGFNFKPDSMPDSQQPSAFAELVERYGHQFVELVDQDHAEWLDLAAYLDSGNANGVPDASVEGPSANAMLPRERFTLTKVIGVIIIFTPPPPPLELLSKVTDSRILLTPPPLKRLPVMVGNTFIFFGERLDP